MSIVADSSEVKDLRKSVTTLTPAERLTAKAEVNAAFALQMKLDRQRPRDDQATGRIAVMPTHPPMDPTGDSGYWTDRYAAGYRRALKILKTGGNLPDFNTDQDWKRFCEDVYQEEQLALEQERLTAKAREDAAKKEADRQRTESNRIIFKKYAPFIHATQGFEVTADAILQATDQESCQFCKSKYPVDLAPRFDILLQASQRGSGVWQRRVHHCIGGTVDGKKFGPRTRILKPFGVWIDLPAAAGLEGSNVPPRVFVDEKPIF